MKLNVKGFHVQGPRLLIALIALFSFTISVDRVHAETNLLVEKAGDHGSEGSRHHYDEPRALMEESKSNSADEEYTSQDASGDALGDFSEDVYDDISEDAPEKEESRPDEQQALRKPTTIKKRANHKYVDLKLLSEFIDLSTAYMVRINHERNFVNTADEVGKFTYIARIGTSLKTSFMSVQNQYNLLRHNGAIYALALAYERRPSQKVLEVMIRAANFLKESTMGPVPKVASDDTDDGKDAESIPNLLAVWENTNVQPSIIHPVAKLGGAGLALVALASLERIAPGSSDMSDLRRIGNFIEWMQNDNGSFTSKYIPSKGGKDYSWNSLYYPGEAALGLVSLANVESDEKFKQKWLKVATKALLYLHNLRENQPLNKVEPDHWALLATAALLPHLDPKVAEYELIYQHGLKVVKAMLHFSTKEQLKLHQGCFTMDGRTCPTATRLEGLIASLSFVRKHETFVGRGETQTEKLRERMLHDIKMGIQFLLNAQEKETKNYMHGAIPVSAKKPQTSSTDEVRVDYVQHAMSVSTKVVSM